MSQSQSHFSNRRAAIRVPSSSLIYTVIVQMASLRVLWCNGKETVALNLHDSSPHFLVHEAFCLVVVL